MTGIISITADQLWLEEAVTKSG